MIDFHSHILPCIDDGAKSPEDAVEMVKQAAVQGVHTVIATPHYNFEELDIKTFLEKRSQAMQQLSQAIEKAGVRGPEIIPGAEIYLMPGTAEREDIGKLCIEGTDVLLIELPIGQWTNWVLNEIYKLRARGFIPVLAHLERYIAHKDNIPKIYKLLDLEVCVQINSDDIFKWKYRKIIKTFVNLAKAVVVGSDSHGSTNRQSEIQKAVRILTKRFGIGIVSEMEDTAEMLVFDGFSF